jgi:hypothetical protein
MRTLPTQLVGISTLGTERYDNFPYFMQNSMGGKLQTPFQVEEAQVNIVRKRDVGPVPPLDYTILKVISEEKTLTQGTDRGMKQTTIAPGDVFDDPSSVDAGVETNQPSVFVALYRSRMVILSTVILDTTTGSSRSCAWTALRCEQRSSRWIDTGIWKKDMTSWLNTLRNDVRWPCPEKD